MKYDIMRGEKKTPREFVTKMYRSTKQRVNEARSGVRQESKRPLNTDFQEKWCKRKRPRKEVRTHTDIARQMVIREKEKLLRREEVKKIALEIEGHGTKETEAEFSTIANLANNPKIVFNDKTCVKSLNSADEHQMFEETSTPVLKLNYTQRGLRKKNVSTLTDKQKNKAKGPLLRRLKLELKKFTKNSNKSDDMNASSKIEKKMKPDHQVEEEKQSTEKENVSHHIGPYVLDDHDFKSLEPRSWINDNIVDAFICSRVSLFQESASSEQASMFHMDTKIVESLKRHGITDRILTYGLREKLLEKDVIICPVNVQGNHWILFLVCPNLEVIACLDSTHRENRPIFEMLSQSLGALEWIQPKESKKFKWNFNAPLDIERQKNSFDCGVYVCLWAEKVCGIDVTLESSDEKRKYILNECKKKYKVEQSCDVITKQIWDVPRWSDKIDISTEVPLGLPSTADFLGEIRFKRFVGRFKKNV
jgi:Ulp1 family protease